jgi:hypothetical protein
MDDVPFTGVPMVLTHGPETHAVTDGDATLFEYLARYARRLSAQHLSAIALVAGASALGATLLGADSWPVLALCYLLWNFSTWGLLFSRIEHPTPLVRIAAGALVASGTIVAIVLSVAAFYWALGPRWNL